MFRFIQTAPEVIVKNLLGTTVVHAPLNGLQEGDTAMASFCRPDKAILQGSWVSSKVSCQVCLAKIAKVQGEATTLNDAYNEGLTKAESKRGMLYDLFVTYSDVDLADAKNMHVVEVRRFLSEAHSTSRSNRLVSIAWHVEYRELALLEIARRKSVAILMESGSELDKAVAEAHSVHEAGRNSYANSPSKDLAAQVERDKKHVPFFLGKGDLRNAANFLYVQTLAELELARRATAAQNEARVQHFQESVHTFVEGVQNAEPFTVTLPERKATMPTENNYGEKQGPFVFTDHPHDQARAERYDETINTLLAMVAHASGPVPSSEELVAAVVGLDHTEAIEEDRAHFPYDSFTRFGQPVAVGHRVGQTTELVYMLGSDVSRTVYSQNMVLLDRGYGMVQAVPEGSLVPAIDCL